MGFVEAGGPAFQGRIHRRPASPLRAAQLPYIQVLILFGSELLPESRHIVSESVGEFTHCRIDPLNRPSIDRFDDAPEHPGPGTGALDRTAMCTRKMYILGRKCAQKGGKKGPKTTDLPSFTFLWRVPH